MKNLFDKLTNTRQKKIIFSIISSFLVFLLCFGLSKTNFVRNLLKLAGIYTQEERVVEFYSNGWDSNEPGSIHVTKSADWIAEDTAEITFDIDSKVKTDTENVDLILALDMSSDDNNDKVNIFKEASLEMARALLNNSNNRLSLISFNNKTSIMSEFTNDIVTIEEQLKSLSASGESNYYLALKEIEGILSNYTVEEEREIIVLMLVDGPSSSLKAYTQYEVLKEKFPNVTITGVSYEKNAYIIDDLVKTTDKQYGATKENLNIILSEASLNPEYYESLVLNDYIDKDFYVENKAAIEVPFGNATLSVEDGTQRITWNIPKNTYRSGNKTTISIKVKLDSKYVDTENYYATNTRESIVYNFPDEESITTNSIKTPVLKNGYKVIYDANPPSGCNISSLETETHNVFSDVTISNKQPACEGFVFAGWEIATDDVDVINENEFIMPSKNVDIKGTWKKLSISKSMEGTIYLRPTYYNIMKSQSLGTDSENYINFNAISSDTNGKGVYTLSGTENDKYPIYYYRGAVTNNNVLFANFCWKMVRTTETGGVKLIYNGVPTNGKCDNSGTSSQLSNTSSFASTDKSVSYVGYMYGNSYDYSYKPMTWYEYYFGSDLYYKSGMASTNYIFGKSVSYSSSKGYTINDGINYLWDDNYSNLKGYYTCLSETSKTCTSIRYVYYGSASGFSYAFMSNGDTYAKIEQKLNANPIVYGNDVTYSNGTYTLKNTSTLSMMKWSSNHDDLSTTHYTCFTTGNTCATVYYIYYGWSQQSYYIALSGGKTIENAVREMTSTSTNTNSSIIKSTIDTWYAKNMKNYTKYLEDTVWCNDRSIYDLGGWTKNGPFDSLTFSFYNRLSEKKPSLTCSNVLDQFSVSNSKAKLTYPVGLLTADEVIYAGAHPNYLNNQFYLYTGQEYLLITPYEKGAYSLTSASVNNNGTISSIGVDELGGVRPAVSLAPGIQYTDGDGSVNSPYVVETK